MPLLAVGVIIGLLLLAWGGMEVDHIMHAYPGQFWMGVFAFLVTTFALAAARFRKANERVPLRPAVPPLPLAIKASPVRLAVAAPGTGDPRDCEGPGCLNKVDDDPWTARVHGEEGEHLFCSEACTGRWQQVNVPWEARRQ